MLPVYSFVPPSSLGACSRFLDQVASGRIQDFAVCNSQSLVDPLVCVFIKISAHSKLQVFIDSIIIWYPINAYYIARRSGCEIPNDIRFNKISGAPKKTTPGSCCHSFLYSQIVIYLIHIMHFQLKIRIVQCRADICFFLADQ